MELILLFAALIFSLINLRSAMIKSYKIGYYEKKLENRNVNIEKVKNMKLLDIWRL